MTTAATFSAERLLRADAPPATQGQTERATSGSLREVDAALVKSFPGPSSTRSRVHHSTRRRQLEARVDWDELT